METGIFLIITLIILSLYHLLNKILKLIYKYINKDNPDQDNDFWKE